MGLALEVGILSDLKTADREGYEHYRQQFALINALLSKNEQPLHTEPEDIPVFSCDMYGYSGLHFLRRIAAHLLVNERMPEPGEENPTSDPVMEACYDEIATMQDVRSARWKRFDHLLCHSDAEGFYIPSEFKEVLFDFDNTGLADPQVGSSYRLLAECLELANLIGMPTNLDPENPLLYEIADAQGEGKGWQRYGKESYTCIRLIKAAEHSIKHSAAIVFT